MALTPSFSIYQTLGFPGTVNLQDTSTGTDVAVISRQVFLITSQATYLVPTGTTTNYIAWILSNASISINALTKDYSLQIVVNWLNVGGAVLYTASQVANFDMYNADFQYSLIYDEASGLASLNSTNWLMSRIKLMIALDDSNNAVTRASNIAAWQAVNERATFLRENKNLFY